MPVNQQEEWSNEKYYTISAVVDRCLDDNELPDHYFDKFLGWALWHLREHNFDNAKEYRSVKLAMNDTRLVECPKDYIDWCIVGIQVGEQVKTLGINENMVDLVGDDRTLGNPQTFNDLGYNTLPNGIDVTNYGGYWLKGGSVFSFGGGIDYKGYFKPFKRPHGWVLQFSSLINKTDIYLEYMSDGFNPNRETMVNPYSVNYLRCAMNHEWAQHKPIKERTESEIRRTGVNLHFAEKKLKGRMSDLGPKEMLNSQRQFYRLTPNT